MSWKLTGIVSQKKLGSTIRKLLMLAMADKANDDGSGVYASMQTLADMCEASKATVKRLTKAFLDEGLIVCVGERPCRNGKTKEYDLVLAAIRALPDVGDAAGFTPNRVHHEPSSPRTGFTLTPEGVHHDPTTGFTVNPKPILKPIQEPLSLGDRSDPPPDNPPKRSKAKRKRTSYSAEFEAFWAGWPKTWRERSDKPLAFKRWQAGRETWEGELIVAAAKRHIENTKRDGHRYTGRADVFLNGKLEAAIEAVTGAVQGQTQEVWDSSLKTWVQSAI